MDWDLVASVSAVTASVEGLSTGFCGPGVGLRENMSLMLLRLSRSNSGSRRPDAGSINLLEYSCWRSPLLNIPGGLSISRIWVLVPDW